MCNKVLVDKFGILVSGPEWNLERRIYQYRFDLGLISVILDAGDKDRSFYEVVEELYPHAKHLIIEFLKNDKS